MALVTQPSRNRMLQDAWDGLRKQQRAEKKAPADAPPPPAKVKKPTKGKGRAK